MSEDEMPKLKYRIYESCYHVEGSCTYVIHNGYTNNVFSGSSQIDKAANDGLDSRYRC